MKTASALSFLIFSFLISTYSFAGEPKKCVLFFKGPDLSYALERATAVGFKLASEEKDADYTIESISYSVPKTSIFHFNQPGNRFYSAVALKNRKGETVAQEGVSSCWAGEGEGCQVIYFHYEQALEKYKNAALKLIPYLDCN